MFIYAGFVAAVAFANPNGGAAYHDIAELSPVAIGSAAPALRVRALTKRSDI